MRNAALHLYWNREKENRGEWKKDVMFSCCRNEKATEVILNLSASLKMSPYSSLSWHPSTRPALSSPCVHARFLPAPWVEGTSQSDSALLRPCPELTSHDKGGTHTVTWSLNNSPFVPSNWGCWSRYNAMPCALPCWPSPNTQMTEQAHTQQVWPQDLLDAHPTPFIQAHKRKIHSAYIKN